MTLQTVFHDTEGRVRCVANGESKATVHGCEKAVSDTDKHGELTTRHTVTVTDGEVTDATYHEPPPNWLVRIAAKREEKLNTSIAVTLSDGDYTIPVNDRSAALGPEAFRRAKDDGSARPFPTDKGIVERDATDLNEISKALDDYITAVWRRAAELQGKVEDGTITEDDLTSGWP